MTNVFYNTQPEPLDSESLEPNDPENPKHDFNFHKGHIIVESDNCSDVQYVFAEKCLKSEFVEFKYAVYFSLVDYDDDSDSPEIWQKWWTNQMLGNNDDGPWRSPNRAMRIGPGCQVA